jgi:hypothetical protein
MEIECLRCGVRADFGPVTTHEGAMAAQAAFGESHRECGPIPMVLHCPNCRTQHIDAPEPDKGWHNPPHKSHLCHRCGIVWRPADVVTTGVAEIATRGEGDTWPPRSVRITVNGVEKRTMGQEVTYDYVIALDDPNERRLMSVTYTGAEGNTQGILSLGQSVRVVDGTRFSVAFTGNA